MTALRSTRTKEEILLLAVSAGAAAVVVSFLVRDVPQTSGLKLATAAALVLSLVTAFAFWFVGAARRAVSEAAQREYDAARSVLSALPEGLLVVVGGRVLSVNPRLCRLLGYERDELVGSTAPFPFWPPEHRHEIERWHDVLASRESRRPARVLASERRPDSRPRRRRPGRVRYGRLALRPHRARRLGESSARAATLGARLTRPGDRPPEPARVRDSPRGRRAEGVDLGSNVTVVLAVLSVDGRTGPQVFRRPEGLVAVERLRAFVRAGDGSHARARTSWRGSSPTRTPTGASARSRGRPTSPCSTASR